MQFKALPPYRMAVLRGNRINNQLNISVGSLSAPELWNAQLPPFALTNSVKSKTN
jgi:hypothetical protein